MKAKDREFAAHSLLTAASRLEASGEDNLEIVLNTPIQIIDQAIINNYLFNQNEAPEMAIYDFSINLPEFTCPHRVVALGHESGYILTCAPELVEKLGDFEETVEMWVLENDKVIERYFG